MDYYESPYEDIDLDAMYEEAHELSRQRLNEHLVSCDLETQKEILQRIERAKPILEQILEHNPNHVGALCDLAFVYRRSNISIHQALDMIDSALEINPFFAPAHYHRAFLMRSRQNFIEAIRLDPTHAWAHANLARYYTYSEPNATEARRHLEIAMRLVPEEASYPRYMGVLVKETESAAAALPWYERALAKNPRHFWILSEMIDVLTACNEMERVQKVFDELFKIQWPKKLERLALTKYARFLEVHFEERDELRVIRGDFQEFHQFQESSFEEWPILSEGMKSLVKFRYPDTVEKMRKYARERKELIYDTFKQFDRTQIDLIACHLFDI